MYKETAELSQWEKDKIGLKIELELLQAKRKQLKEECDYIKSTFEGGISNDIMICEALIIKVVRVLNEKFNHNILYLDQCEFANEELLFEYDCGTITYFDGEFTVELFSTTESADSFKYIYDSSVATLKEHIKKGYNRKEDKKFFSTF